MAKKNFSTEKIIRKLRVAMDQEVFRLVKSCGLSVKILKKKPKKNISDWPQA
jgi:hypothetical protein